MILNPQRLIFKEAGSGGVFDWDAKPDIWAVLSSDFREEEMTGTLEECQRYLQSQCPTGTCED